MWQLIHRTCWLTLSNGTVLKPRRRIAATHFFSPLKSCKVINLNAHGIHIITVETRNYLNKIIYNTSFQQSRWIYPSIAWEGLVKFYEIKSSVKTRLLFTDIVDCVVCFFSNERISSLSHKSRKLHTSGFMFFLHLRQILTLLRPALIAAAQPRKAKS